MANLSFSEQATLVVLDKGFFGLIVVLATLWGAKLLERFKFKQALRTEFAKRTADEVGKVWTEIDEIHSKISSLAIDILERLFDIRREAAAHGAEVKITPEPEAINDSERAQLGVEFSAPIQTLKQRTQLLGQQISRSGFWIGRRPMASLYRRKGTLSIILQSLSEFDLKANPHTPPAFKDEEKDDIYSFVDLL